MEPTEPYEKEGFFGNVVFTNGHTVDRQGRLVSCEHGTRRVTRTEHDGSLTVLADSYDGKRLNSPNDVVVRSDGSIWFTDPAYGIDSDYEGFAAPQEQDGDYVFRLAPPDVKVGDGAIYDVSLSHSPDRPRKGQPVTIRAQVSGVAPGTPLTYSWRFSDGPGKRTTVPRVVHRFGRAGGRWVSVTVSGGDGSGEGFRSIDVRQDDDGGDGGKPPDPTEPSVPSPTPTGSGFDGGGYGYGYGSGGFDQPGLSGQPSVSPEPSNEPEPAAPADGLEEVSGVLIDPVVSGGPTGDAQQVEADPAGGGFGFSGEAATLFGVGLLIALGGLIEVRVLSRRL